MSTPVTLGLFAAGLALVFTGSATVGAAVGPKGEVRPAEHGITQTTPAADHGRGHSG